MRTTKKLIVPQDFKYFTTGIRYYKKRASQQDNMANKRKIG